jgi:hypothetical protein
MSDLSNIVHSRIWPYLVEVHRRLDVSVELIDESLAPLLDSGGDHSLSDRRRVFDRMDEPVRDAVMRSMTSLELEVVTSGAAPIVCAPLIGRGGSAVGAVLVTSGALQRGADRGAVSKLVRVGAWLAGAVSTQLNASARLDTSELDQFASLYRLLKQAAATGSEREVIRCFVEALAVWQDEESWGYVGDLTGRFVLDVALPGSDRARVPAVIDGQRIAADLVTAQPSAAEFDEMGFHGGNAILSRIRCQSSSDWVIVICDSIDPAAKARIGVYAEAVGQVLGEMTAVQATRLAWVQLQHLLPTTESPDVAARGAILELAAAIQGRACLAVSRLDGARVLTIGEAAELATLPVPTRDRQTLTLPIELPLPYRAVIGVTRDGDVPLTCRDELLVQSTASTLGAWLPSVASRLPIELERRTGRRSFDEIIDQHADMVMAGGYPVSVIVISLGTEPTHLDAVAQACVSHVRGLLRPTDMAGRLSSGHIGVVLPDTPKDGASVVAERVQQLMTSHADFGLFPKASLSFASRSPGSLTPSSLSLLLEAWTRMGARDLMGRTPGGPGSTLAN